MVLLAASLLTLRSCIESIRAQSISTECTRRIHWVNEERASEERRRDAIETRLGQDSGMATRLKRAARS